MLIKNDMKGWTVRTEATKGGSGGVAGREIYFADMENANHVKTERIVPIWGNAECIAKIAFNGERQAAKLKAAGRGGRPPASYAVEFSLNLPKGYRPTPKEWRLITKDVIIGVAKRLGVTPKLLADQVRAVLHQQDQTPEICPRTGRELGTGDHLHLVVGKFTPDGVHLRDLQRKTVTHVVKEVFNDATLRHCGYDWTEYKKHKLQAQEFANKRAISPWKVKAAREVEAIRAQHQALDERTAFLVGKTKELEVIQDDLDDQFNDDMAVKRLIGNFSRQSEKLLKSLEEHDVTQVNRQVNRICRTVDELGAFSMSDKDQVWIDKLTKAINEHEGIESQRIPALSDARTKHRMRM